MLQVKNWDKFQHYKNRDEPAAWIKLHARLLADYEFNQLSDSDQAKLMKLWLLAAQLKNRLPYDEVWLRKRISARTLDLRLFISRGWLEEVYSDARDSLASEEKRRTTEYKAENYTLPFKKLMNALTDKDDKTEQTILNLAYRYYLSEGDFMWALECATGPGVESPTKVAVAELRKRGQGRAA